MNEENLTEAEFISINNIGTIDASITNNYL